MVCCCITATSDRNSGDVTDSNRLNTDLPADGRQQLDGPAEDQAHA